MAISNRERVGKGLDLLTGGLQPFVERELKAAHSDTWLDVAQASFRQGPKTKKATGAVKWDAHAILTIMWDQWNAVFGHTLGQAERSLVSELRDARNRCPIPAASGCTTATSRPASKRPRHRKPVCAFETDRR